MRKRKILSVLSIIGLSIGITVFFSSVFPELVLGQTGSNAPDDQTLVAQRQLERDSQLRVAVPPVNQIYTPSQRVPRNTWGEVGSAPLSLATLDNLVFPDVSTLEREQLVEGAAFFTIPHTVAEGAGPMANQPNCLGCHLNSAEVVPGQGLITGLSNVSRGARATPTNFLFVGGNATTGGRPPNSIDAINNTGRTAAFTIFGDFSPSIEAARDPLQPAVPDRAYDPLNGVFVNPRPGGTAQQFGGFVLHNRPPVTACLADRLPTIAEDLNLGTINPTTGLSPSGWRRSVGERSGPPYVGLGLREAIPNADIMAAGDPSDSRSLASSLNQSSLFGCTGDCVAGHANIIPANGNGITAFVGTNPPAEPVVGRFGLKANGGEILQFVIGGLQGELGLTSLISPSEINLADINQARPGCFDGVPDPEFHLSTPFSERNFLRLTAPPEFGQNLLNLLKSPDSRIEGRSLLLTPVAKVKRGAELFGIDVVAFANRTIAGRMPTGGDGRNLNAINTADAMVGCVSCHTPIQRTGQSPAVGIDATLVSRHLSFKYAPLFTDLIVHKVPVIDAERFATIPRTPWQVPRPPLRTEGLKGRLTPLRPFNTFDLPRNFADDAFLPQKSAAAGNEFRTPSLSGMGRIGAPFMHDGRVYLSSLTVNTTPAGTVYTNSEVTNAPFAVRTIDDAIRAAIELHDLPAPDDSKTPAGGGCPIPAAGVTNVNYGANPANVVCPPYNSAVSRANRSDAREVIRRYRSLSANEQQSIIDFLKEL